MHSFRALGALLLLAGCQPPLSGAFDTAAGGPAQTALVTVPNPFWCQKDATP